MLDQNISIINETSDMLNGSGFVNNYTSHEDGGNTGFYFYLYDITWPILTLLGMIGNSLAFIVLYQLSSTSSFYLYLAFLAISDFSFLIVGGVFRWLEMTGMYTPSKSFEEMLCSVSFAFTLLFSQLSSWITVAVTVDRYIAVCHPFAVSVYCTRKRTLIYVGTAFLVLAALNLPNICLQWDHETLTCVLPEFTHDYCFKFRGYIDILSYAIIPILIICILNILIIRGLYSAAGRRRFLTSGSESSAPPTVERKDSISKTVSMLFSVTACFVLLFIPFVGVSLHEVVYGYGWDSIPGTLADLCSFLNHCLNFILYGLSGQRFRKKFIETLNMRRVFRD
ncbi:FMRFamide receptor-like [Ylistrum balloti]|uniref:FMRFamide receptor-like n=1 Tax=Ylistrum balloti TaxID=509963 RepID=UPI002905B2B0|nr:FMRFamide receptor-like [Ylistrum balloti]